MTAGTSSAEDQSRQPSEADTSERTGLLVGGADRCAGCGAALAVDQRYCVECGARRGKPRFALAPATSGEAPSSAAPTVAGAGGWSRVAALLAVIAVLVAIGVGVLIGNASQASIRQPVKVELTGGTVSSTGNAAGGSGASGIQSTSKGGSGSSSVTSCTNGTAGCKDGKQTGNFFGGG